MRTATTSEDVDRGPVDARPAASRDLPLGFRTPLVALFADLAPVAHLAVEGWRITLR